MSPLVTIKRLAFLLVVVVLAATGCGTANDQSVFDPDTQKHPDGWLPELHVAPAQANIESCKECHGEDLLGGIAGVSCSTCHTNGMIAVTGCISCHGNPPNGTAAPNRAGSHAPHNALPNVAGVCGTCHNGAGTMTVKHFNGTVDVLILNVYNAKTGTAVRNADGTCSEVSCHGGQTTPVWLTGTIDVASQCAVCHALGTTEYNSYFSGEHALHVNQLGLACVECHNLTKLAVNHFTTLNTQAMEGPASATMQDSLNYSSGVCTPLCHGTRTW